MENLQCAMRSDKQKLTSTRKATCFIRACTRTKHGVQLSSLDIKVTRRGKDLRHLMDTRAPGMVALQQKCRGLPDPCCRVKTTGCRSVLRRANLRRPGPGTYVLGLVNPGAALKIRWRLTDRRERTTEVDDDNHSGGCWCDAMRGW